MNQANHTQSRDLSWLVSDFTSRVPDAAHAAVISADGLPMALSEHIPQEFIEQFACITSGLSSLMAGAARIMDAGQATQALVEMDAGLLLIKTISDGSTLTVLAASECDTDLVTYEMTLLVEAVGEALTPELRTTEV